MTVEMISEMYSTLINIVHLFFFCVGMLTGVICGVFLWGRFKC